MNVTKRLIVVLNAAIWATCIAGILMGIGGAVGGFMQGRLIPMAVGLALCFAFSLMSIRHMAIRRSRKRRFREIVAARSHRPDGA